MSALTINKLKKQFRISQPTKSEKVQTEINFEPHVTVVTGEAYIKPILAIGGPESTRLLAEMNQCGFNIIKGVKVPLSSNKPPPISPKITPASIRTAQIIEATLIASVSPTDPTTRFSNFFPAPIPPPQFLQPEFVKYKINYEPVTRQIPCIGSRRYDQ